MKKHPDAPAMFVGVTDLEYDPVLFKRCSDYALSLSKEQLKARIKEIYKCKNLTRSFRKGLRKTQPSL